MQINRYVGASETIDRLLGITKEEEFAGNRRDVEPIVLLGIVGRKEQEKLSLDRVRILKLVNEVMREALLQLFAHGKIVANQITGLDEQVKEIEIAPARFEFLIRGQRGLEGLLQQRSKIRIAPFKECIEFSFC